MNDKIKNGYDTVKAIIKKKIASNPSLDDVPDEYYLFSHTIGETNPDGRMEMVGWNIPTNLPLPHRCMLIQVGFDTNYTPVGLWTASVILTEKDLHQTYFPK